MIKDQEYRKSKVQVDDKKQEYRKSKVQSWYYTKVKM